VISASRSIEKLGTDEIASLVDREIREVLPTACDAVLEHVRVVTEKSATYSVAPGVDQFRPEVETEIADLALAGDWIRTGWPATMEGAVRSGYAAARHLIRSIVGPVDADRADRLIAALTIADLPTELIPRLLIRR
jgi:uncharacterized protein with NAD-binding domain and iron-sulfur cluster